MQRYSPYRISAVVLLPSIGLLILTSSARLGDQDFDPAALVWLALAYAVVGPLVLTNVLWFTAIDRVGPSRATLFANLQPFVAAIFAVVLLSEDLGALQVVGGVLIAAGIVVARVGGRPRARGQPR